MWAKLLQLVLMPLIEKSVVALFKYFQNMFKEWNRKRKLKKETEEKIKKFKESKTDEDITDSFNNLP